MLTFICTWCQLIEADFALRFGPFNCNQLRWPLTLHFLHSQIEMVISGVQLYQSQMLTVTHSDSIARKRKQTLRGAKWGFRYRQPFNIYLFRVIYFDMWTLSSVNVMGTWNKYHMPIKAKKALKKSGEKLRNFSIRIHEITLSGALHELLWLKCNFFGV